MHKILIFFLFNLVVISTKAQQSFQLTAFGGLMNYSGELNSSFRVANSNASFGLGVQYNVTPKWSAQLNLTYGKIHAHDSTNSANTALRNLSFNNNIIELNALAVYHLRDLYDKVWTPYLTGGIAYFHHDPYVQFSGQKVKLRPLSTEGQGLPSGRVKAYSPHQIAVPFGGGIKVNLSGNVQLGYEVVLRKLFTDYIDDVGGRYADQAELLANRGALAVELSYRTDELPGGDPNYPIAGVLRGSPGVKDWYFTHGLRLYINLNSNKGLKYMRCFKF